MHLPREILVKIFSYYLNTENQALFYNSVCRVCKEWRTVAMSSCSLWRTVDNSLNKRTLLCLCKTGHLKYCKELDLSNLGSELTSKNLELILNSCPNLTSIDLSNGKNVTFKILSLLPKCCPTLSQINFSNICPDLQRDVLCKPLDDFYTVCGQNVVHLNFSYNYIVNFIGLMQRVAMSCPNLQELHLLYVQGSKIMFPTEAVQAGCSQLKVLCMGDNIKFSSFREKSSNTVGFPNLEVFTFCVNQGYGPNVQEFERLLKHSNKLKLLDVRGCQYVPAEMLLDLTTDLEQLFLARSNVCSSQYLAQILLKFSYCLRQLDLSGTINNIVDNAVMSLASSASELSIEDLYLSSTNVTIPTVKQILDHSPELKNLDLNSCRNFPKQTKRAFHGKTDLNKLQIRLGDELSCMK